jgi:hypothetical protein
MTWIDWLRRKPIIFHIIYVFLNVCVDEYITYIYTVLQSRTGVSRPQARLPDACAQWYLRDANLRSERGKGGLLPDTQGRPTHDRPADLYFASPDVCEGDGTDWVAAAFDVTVVSSYTETRERSPLLTASAKAA